MQCDWPGFAHRRAEYYLKTPLPHAQAEGIFTARTPPAGYTGYRACLNDSFGAEYVEHRERWLEADGAILTVPA